MNRKAFRTNARKVLYFIYIIGGVHNFIDIGTLKGEFIFIKSDSEFKKIINYLLDKYYLTNKGNSDDVKLSYKGYRFISHFMNHTALK